MFEQTKRIDNVHLKKNAIIKVLCCRCMPLHTAAAACIFHAVNCLQTCIYFNFSCVCAGRNIALYTYFITTGEVP